MHIERLKNIKSSLDMEKPKKPIFIKHNFKKELINMGKTITIMIESFIYNNDL
jgi:hypothetical protein